MTNVRIIYVIARHPLQFLSLIKRLNHRPPPTASDTTHGCLPSPHLIISNQPSIAPIVNSIACIIYRVVRYQQVTREREMLYRLRNFLTGGAMRLHHTFTLLEFRHTHLNAVHHGLHFHQRVLFEVLR
jgi:hypothetical protein